MRSLFARLVVLLVSVSFAATPAGARADHLERAGDALQAALGVAAVSRGVKLDTVAPVRGTDLRAALASHVPAGDVAPTLARLAPLSSAERGAVASLLDAMTIAGHQRDLAFARVTPDELAFLSGPERTTDAGRAISIVDRIDMRSMLQASMLLGSTAAAAMPDLGTVSLLEPMCTSNGALCIGTESDDVWTEDVQLLIDPAGDDLYLNNAGGVMNEPVRAATGGCVLGGGVTGRARPNLDCSPAPGTVCTYDTANRATERDDLPVAGLPGHADPDGPSGGTGNDGSCGSDARREQVVAGTQGLPDDADSRGVALLLDLDGSDTYTVPWSHDDPLFNLIEDCYPGEADRVNTNRDLFQGSALAGIGILWDAGDGNDRYRGRLNAQGSGHVGGVGLLIASGTGDAHFWADRLSQGNGIAGGVGALVNVKDGAHTYLLDAPLVYRNEFGPNGRGCSQEGRAGQGEGGFAGAGILWNQNAGTAIYRAVTHLTQNSYPYAPILDGSGAPRLTAGTDAQGSGESFPIADTPGGLVVGVGLLLDATDGDASVCPADPDAPSAGMASGSSTGTGTSLSSAGAPRACGKFNLPAELSAGDLGAALQHLSAGAVGMRVVI